ncbi:MAG: AraC family transcriptional regulator [Epibacterium sp.]|nr:AraC family transcriptional regulator [Epibacterium sp.]NQX75733.1 helix-turn-helix transcriptional regulator [Epibacterium sp.]
MGNPRSNGTLPNAGQRQEDPVTPEEFSEVSQVFCEEYALQGRAGGDGALFSGVLSVRSLNCGIHLSTARLQALQSSEHAVIFPRSLCLVLSLDGTSSEINPGNGKPQVLGQAEMAAFSFSDEICSIGRYTAGQSSTSVLLQLREDTVQDAELQEVIHQRTRQSETALLGYHPRMAEIGSSLCRPPASGAVGNLMTESQVLELVARAIMAREDGGGSGRQGLDLKKMQRVRDMLAAHPERDHTLAALAREAGLSVSGLKVKFRDAYGMPVFAYLREQRMLRARDGLSREGWSVKQAASFTGYRHPANFSTAFQRQFGISPKDCR